MASQAPPDFSSAHPSASALQAQPAIWAGARVLQCPSLRKAASVCSKPRTHTGGPQPQGPSPPSGGGGHWRPGSSSRPSQAPATQQSPRVGRARAGPLHPDAGSGTRGPGPEAGRSWTCRRHLGCAGQTAGWPGGGWAPRRGRLGVATSRTPPARQVAEQPLSLSLSPPLPSPGAREPAQWPLPLSCPGSRWPGPPRPGAARPWEPGAEDRQGLTLFVILLLILRWASGSRCSDLLERKR